MEPPILSHEHYHASSTDDDLLPIVDEQDNVIGAGTRRDIHMKGLPHRAVHIIVTNARGQLLLQRRSMAKDSHPGWWDISVGGHVDVGEEYEQAALRELREELAVAATFIEVARRHWQEGPGREFIRIYECPCEGPFTPHPQEIDEVRWVDAPAFLLKASPEQDDPDYRVTGSGLFSMKRWAQTKGII